MASIQIRFSVEKWLLRRLRRYLGGAPLRVVIRGHSEEVPAQPPCVATLVIHDLPTLLRILVNPEIGIGDGYAGGTLEVEGDLVRALEAAYHSIPLRRIGVAGRWANRLRGNTARRSRLNVHHHYDITTEFYQLWLDPQLVYTCAYFPTPSATLEEAQTAKLDYICRKLQLQPGETVAEAGFGWGALALHMARHYGVHVKAFNLSHEQTVFARTRARSEGLDPQVEFIEDDYRNIDGKFDAFVSVGMLEHVGLSHYEDLGKVLHRTVGASGRGLLHFIGRNYPAPMSAWIEKRIFPGAYPPALREVMRIFEPWDLSVCDVENLRQHYARTLEHWLARFENSAQQVEAMFDAQFVRAWRLYLAGSLTAFRVGTMQLFQVTFAGPECRRLPCTRAHLYEREFLPEEPKWIHVMS